MVRIDFKKIGFKFFHSKERKELSVNPELDYFMNEEKSDVVFVVEGQPIPAIKSFLSIRNKVFRAMFSEEFKESKDKEIVIEDTTYEAFNTFIRFLYCDDLVLKDDNDFELIRELYRLCDRYDVFRLFVRLTDKLYERSQTLSESREDFEEVWPKMQCILKIAFEYKIEKLMDKVMEFIGKKLHYFLDEEENKVLIKLNDSTDGRIFTLIWDTFTKFSESVYKNKFKELLILVTKKSQQLNEVNESLKKVKSFNCEECGALNHVNSINTST